MGVEIYGWIEIRDAALDEFLEEVNWHGVVDVGYFLPRNTNALSCLFGVRNPSNFVPIAASRGLPTDDQQRLKRLWGHKVGHIIIRGLHGRN